MNSKLTGGIALVAVLVAGIAVYQRNRAISAERAGIAGRAALQAKLAAAEKRSADAERDNERLLKAIETTTPAAAPTVPVYVAPAPAASLSRDQQRLIAERAYQKELAERRARQAPKLEDQFAAVNAEVDYLRLLDEASLLAAQSDFMGATRKYNEAMEKKPPGLALSEEAKALQATLRAHQPR